MKKVLLASTSLATLLLVGGINVAADVVTPESQDIPVRVVAGGAEFTFADHMIASPIEVTPALIDGIQLGTLVNVGGVLTNLNLVSEAVTVSASSELDGLVVNGGTTVSAEAVQETENMVNIEFSINRDAVLASDEERVITVKAQDSGTIDSGESF